MFPFFSLAFLVIISLLAFIYAKFPTLFTHDPFLINSSVILQAPNLEHIAGTDALGRDLFTRLILGAQMSLSIAFLTALIALLIGVCFAVSAAYIGGKVDALILKFIDLIYSLPDLLILSMIGLCFARSNTAIIIGLASINWMEIARITRAELLKLKNEEFILASKLIGLNHFQIIFKHLLPNALGLILVALGFTLPRAILSESTLSFIGLGLTPPNTSWGTLAGDAFQYLRTDPHLLFFPAALIFLTSFSFNRISEMLSKRFSSRPV